MLDSLLALLHRLEFHWPWLWLLLPLPFALRLLPAPGFSHSHSVRVPNLPNLLGASQAAPAAPGRRRLPLLLFAVIWFCLVFAASRPQWLVPASYQEVAVRDLVLVVDVSASMATEDMQDSKGGQTSRMVAMQDAVRTFIGARRDDNIGLIVFGSQAYPFAPLSRAHRVLLERVDELRPAMAGPQTAIGDALGSTIRMFRAMTVNEAGAKERMVVLLTDGQDTASTLPPEVALRLAKQEHVTVHTIALGAGGEDGANLTLLRKIASDTGGTFHLAAQSAQSLQEVYATLDRITPRKVHQLGWSYRRSLYPYPLAVALGGLALLALVLRARANRHG